MDRRSEPLIIKIMMNSATKPRAGSRVFPSIIFCALSFALALLPAFFSAPVDSDLWWQLRVGLDMLEAGELLGQDPYSYATGHSPWVNHEWLAQLILARVYESGGNAGLSILRGVQLCTILLLLFWIGILLWGSGVTPITFYLLCFVFPITSFYLNLRPRGFAFVFLILLALLHLLYKRGFKRPLYFYPIIIALFCNMHGAFVLGLIFCLCSTASLYLCNDSFGAKSSQSGERSKLGLITLACLLAPLANPYGIDLLFFSFAELGTQHPNIGEWQSLNSQQLPAFLLLFALIGLSMLLKPYRFDQPTFFLFYLATAYLAFKHNRFFILFLFFSTILLFSRMEAIWQLLCGANSGKLVKFCKSWMPLALLTLFLFPLSYLQITRALSAPSSILVDVRRYPVQAVDFLRQNELGAKLGIQFDWGGYALWHLYPKYQISIDGRYASVYGSAYADRQITSYMSGDLSAFNAGAQMQTILVARNSALEASLLKADGWKMVFSDPIAAVFVLGEQFNRAVVELESLPQYKAFP